MTASETIPSGAVAAPGDAALGTVYGALASCFEQPDDDVYEALSTGLLTAEFEDLLDRSDLDVSVPRLETEDDPTLLEARFNDLFAVGYPDPPVSRYESDHVDGIWNDVNLDLTRLYEYFDVAVDTDQRDHPDFLVYELEFAGYLARLAAAGEDDARRARADFLDRHLKPFLEGMAAAIEDERETGVYGALVEFAVAFVATDLAALREAAGETP
jgi:DMSO reductase family type II enzyme chaperone